MEKFNLRDININSNIIYRNLSVPSLVEEAISNKEGILSNKGALVVETGKYTGRSPKDKFIVDTDKVHNNINWGTVNVPVDKKVFLNLKEDVTKYLSSKKLYVFDGFAGADKRYEVKFRIVNELSSQNLFIHQLLVRPTNDDLMNFIPDYTILVAPNYKCDYKKLNLNSEAAIIIDYEEHFAIIVGSSYSGEIKKTVFSIMNYCMPLEYNVLPMHCSANMDLVSKDTALFFGLSGTGKTTLSADENRKLIGDDEHGFSDDSIFNFEGGCYAKCCNLKKENEKEIYNAIKFGAIAENVGINIETRELDFFDLHLTENTRVGYSIDFIPNSELSGCGNVPKVVIFLTADAFGVLPPISKLDKNQAMYHFITGFTSKLAGTERGIITPMPTFSTLFGEPFMPLNPKVYANMFGEKIDKFNLRVYLINTGWSGGGYGVGERIKLKYTREMVNACLNGKIENSEFTYNELFNLKVPNSIENVPSEILNPRNTWEDKKAYDDQALSLAKMFKKNFNDKYNDMPDFIKNAGPNC